GIRQQPSYVDEGLLIDRLPVRRLEDRRPRAERHLQLPVRLVCGRPRCVEQRQKLAPLDVPARRTGEHLLQGVSVMGAETGGYGSSLPTAAGVRLRAVTDRLRKTRSLAAPADSPRTFRESADAVSPLFRAD